MPGIFHLLGEIVADLAAKALTVTGRTALADARAGRGGRSLGTVAPSPLPLPETIDEASVVAAYERHLGEGVDLEASLFHGPLTPIVALAGLGDLALPIALLLPTTGSRFELPFAFFTLILAAIWFIGFRLSRPELEQAGQREAMPIGVFTGLLLRARRLQRMGALAGGPFSSDDPKVIGPVVREWAGPLLERAEVWREAPLRPRVARIERFGGDPATLRRLEQESVEADVRLEGASAAMRALVADPLSIHRSPLIAARETFAALRSALEEAESLGAEIALVRRNLASVGALEEPIRLNAG